jgi:hypothetical protein
LFNDISVPPELRVDLLKPYLSDKARTLLNRLTGSKAGDFAVVKRFLLDQYRLVSQYFLEQFNRAQKQPSETYRAFMSRLALLLQYYMEARRVNDFNSVCDLLIADKVKSTLSESALRHILIAEGTEAKNWLRPDKLSDSLDVFYANHLPNDKPRASALGASLRTQPES